MDAKKTDIVKEGEGEKLVPFSHCSACGTKYAVDYGENDWPRRCVNAKCKFMIWRNPFPVCVVLLRVAHGFLGVRRGINPGKGQIALPGGFHNYGEDWRRAMARELEEETGIIVPEDKVHLFTVITGVGRHHITFGWIDMHLAELPPLAQKPNPETGENETEELLIFNGDETLAFPSHTTALHQYAKLHRYMTEHVRLQQELLVAT